MITRVCLRLSCLMRVWVREFLPPSGGFLRKVAVSVIPEPADLFVSREIHKVRLESDAVTLKGSTLAEQLTQADVVTGAPPYAHDGQLVMLISNDLGATWGEYDIQGLGERSAIRFHRPNGEGWFRCDLRVGDTGSDPGEVMFFKMRPGS
jgi:hypothetical protein